jgi:hypothetical protein
VASEMARQIHLTETTGPKVLEDDLEAIADQYPNGRDANSTNPTEQPR